MTAAPLFVFGIARGGTNLLARMVDAHPVAAVALDPFMPLFRFWRNAAVEAVKSRLLRPRSPSEPFQDGYFDPDGPTLIEALLSADSDTLIPPSIYTDLRASIAERAALEAPDLAARLGMIEGSTIAGMFRSGLSIIDEAARAGGKTDLLIAGAKEVWTADFIPGLARGIPGARFALIHRDPRAIVLSLQTLGEKDESQKAHAVSYMRHWRKQVALAQRFAADPVLKDRLFVTTFERLCSAPESEARRLCLMLGIDFDAAMLRPGEASGWTGNSSFGQNLEPIDPVAADRWRRRIAPEVRAAVEFHCAPEMRALGYDVPADAEELTETIAKAVFGFHADPGKWRSDSGDPAGDLAWEVLRHRVIKAPSAGWPEELRSRCMLI